MKKREMKMVISLMAEEILQQKAAARHYRQERDMKSIQLREARQASAELFEASLITESEREGPR